jgi:hypothetical protein
MLLQKSKNIYAHVINGTVGLASLQAPSLRLNASPPYAGILEGMKAELGYKSFFGERLG